MIHIEVTRGFRSAPEDVFQAYVDRSGWKRRAAVAGGPIEDEVAKERRRVGAVRVAGVRGMELREQLVEIDAPKQLVYRVVHGAVGFRKHLGEVLFEPDGEGTLLQWKVRLEPTLPLTGPLIEAATTRLLRKSLTGLARHLGAVDPGR